MTKYKYFFDLEKEEKWLEEMAKNGYQLCNTPSFGYQFVKCPPEELQIRIDFRQFKNQSSFQDYCSMFEDSGWIHIAGTISSGSQYFKKISFHTHETNNCPSNEDNEIFSDQASKAGRYKRISNMWLDLAIAFLPLLFVEIIRGIQGTYSIFAPKEWFLTPGLWEEEGWNFWFAFLFESPFAILRGLPFLPLLLVLMLYGIFSYKSWQLYKKTNRECE